MKKAIIAVLISVAVLLSMGCTSTTRMNSISGTDTYANTAVARKDFDIVGTVSVEGTVENIMGVYTRGGVTHKQLLDAAKEMGGDAVINVYRDVTRRSYFIFYNTRTEILTGTVIKYTNAVRQ